MRPVAEGADLARRDWAEGAAFIVDFGEHLTGYLSFCAVPVGSVADSPIRLRFTFGEVPTVVAEPDGPVAAIYKQIARTIAIKVAEKAKDMTSKFPSIVIKND